MGSNLTLAVDPKTVERARAVARRQGTSLNALIRGYIARLAGERGGSEVYDQLKALWASGGGHSKGKRFARDEVYEERIGRSRVR